MMTRRTFVGLLAATGLAALSHAQAIGAAAGEELELDGHWAGWTTITGGELSVLTRPLDRGPGGRLPPPTSQRLLSDLQLRFASGMSTKFYQWLGTCLEHRPPAAAILAGIPAGGEQERRWAEAYVTDLFLPALDAQRRTPVQLSATVHARSVLRLTRPHALRPPHHHPASWRSHDFRFCIPGLEHLTRSVSSIAPLHFHRPLATNVLGADRRNHVRAGEPQYPQLRLSLDPADRRRLVEALHRPGRHRGLLELTLPSGEPWLGIVFSGLQPAPGGPDTLDLHFASARLRT